MKRRHFISTGLVGASAVIGRQTLGADAALAATIADKHRVPAADLPRIGVASVDITPPVGVVMVGYQARISTEAAHPLRAEALVCQGQNGAWALVTSDTIGYTADLAHEIRAAISAATEIPIAAVILSGTHTHSGPGTVVFGRQEKLSHLDSDYFAALPSKLAGLVQRALDHATPGYFETTSTTAPDFGHNRRVRHPDGTWGNEWHDPDGQHTGFYDPTVLLVGIRRPNGRRDALLVNFGCHPVVLGPRNLALSGDYVTYMRERLEREGGVGLAMFALAGCGNINPRVCIQADLSYPRAAGETLARIVLDALPRLAPTAAGAIAAHREPWSFIRTREILKFKARGQEQRVGEAVRTEFVAARAGELGLIAIPGELFSEFNPRIRQASPTRDTVIVTLANDYIGYLPTDQAQEEGAYETQMAPADKLEQPLMQAVQRTFSHI